MSTFWSDDMQDATARAIEEAGGASHIARQLGIVRATVSVWKVRGRVPAKYVLDLERLCEAKVTRYELRPDVFSR